MSGLFVYFPPLKMTQSNEYSNRALKTKHCNRKVVYIMKRMLSSLLLGSVLLFPALAAADSGAELVGSVDTQVATVVEAGLTPDDTLYTFDQALEKIELLLTWNADSKAKLYATLSEERLAELMALEEELRLTYVQNLLVTYRDYLDLAIVKLEQAKAEGSTEVEAVSQLLDRVASNGQLSLKVVEKWKVKARTDKEGQAQEGQAAVKEMPAQDGEPVDDTAVVEEVIAKAKVTANVVSQLDAEVVQSLREKGLGYGQIALTVSLAEKAGKTVDEIVQLTSEGKGIGAVAKQLGIHPGSLMGNGKGQSSDAKDEGKSAIKLKAVSDVKVKGNAGATGSIKEQDTALEVDLGTGLSVKSDNGLSISLGSNDKTNQKEKKGKDKE